MKTNRNVSGNAAFTLVEITIVVAILGVLAVIAIPNFIRARAAMKKSAAEWRIESQTAGSICVNDPGWLPGVTNVIVVSNHLVTATSMYDVTVEYNQYGNKYNLVVLSPKQLTVGSTGVLEKVRFRNAAYWDPKNILFVREKTD